MFQSQLYELQTMKPDPEFHPDSPLSAGDSIPLWCDEMVREFGEEDGERILKEFRLEIR